MVLRQMRLTPAWSGFLSSGPPKRTLAHLKTPHVAAFLEACAALEILDMEVRRYEVSSVGDLVMPE